MSRYVNAEDVEYLILENLDDLSELIKTAKGTDREKLLFKEMGLLDAMAHLCQAPTADVAEVVRCKHCRFNTGENKCLYPDSIIRIPADDDFCSYGRKKEEINNGI